MTTVGTLIIGAGPAGLAASQALSARGLPHLVLERGGEAGHSWTRFYDCLRLHTSKRLSALTGLPFSRETPRFPGRLDVVTYLQQFARAFDVPVTTGVTVTALERVGDGWIAQTSGAGDVRTRSVVVASGIAANPYQPDIPGRSGFVGRTLHAADYRRPDEFRGQRVLVVGAGNSAADIAVDLSRGGAVVAIAVRSGATVVPQLIAGIPVQYLALVIGTLPAPAQKIVLGRFAAVAGRMHGARVLPPAPRTECRNVPLIGFQLVDAIRSRAVRLVAGVTAFTSAGVCFSDGRGEPFDTVILATGFRPALGYLGNAVRLDRCGFAVRRDLVTSADQPDLYFVGHNYGIRGGLFNMRRDAALVARHIGSK